ncbi:MAG: PPOX class F420-dependent oxidoreductase [Candidatus Dormiibacterota bacterium]
MDIEEAREFLRHNDRGVLVTLRADGRPQTSPVNAAIDGEGRLVVSSRETALKVRNLRRDPRATFCGFTERFFGEWVQADGQAEIVSLPEAMDGLVDYYQRLAGEHPDWDDYRAAMVREKRCLIRVAIERAGPTRQG